MTVREISDLFFESAAFALVVISLGCVVLVALLISGNMP